MIGAHCLPRAVGAAPILECEVVNPKKYRKRARHLQLQLRKMSPRHVWLHYHGTNGSLESQYIGVVVPGKVK